MRPEDVARVFAFRNRLVAYGYYVESHRPDYGEDFKPAARQHIGSERSALLMEYGKVHKLVRRYGIAAMTQFGGIVSQDVVRDAIGRLDHPSRPAVMDMAVNHLDEVLGHLGAEVEAKRSGLSADTVYRYTSIAFWIGRLLAVVRWLILTGRGRIVALVGLIVTAVIGGIASGIAQAWWEQLTR